jgi:hypothetical protein
MTRNRWAKVEAGRYTYGGYEARRMDHTSSRGQSVWAVFCHGIICQTPGGSLVVRSRLRDAKKWIEKDAGLDAVRSE